jgi:hypothetical protein
VFGFGLKKVLLLSDYPLLKLKFIVFVTIIVLLVKLVFVWDGGGDWLDWLFGNEEVFYF